MANELPPVAPPSPAWQRPAMPGELQELYASWSILDLVGETVAAMPAAWLQVLEIARNIMARKPIPGVEMPHEISRLVTHPDPAFTTVVKTKRVRRVSYSRNDDTLVLPLRNYMDFPQISLPDLMLRDLDPELFEHQAVSGGINGVYSVERPPSIEEFDELVEERVPTNAPLRKKRQKVYALLDVSNSMRDGNKILFAKALMLAYLITAHDEDAHLYYRTFGNTVHARTDCTEPGAFGELARRVLTVTPDGATDIKGALDAAVSDIRALDQVNRYERMFESADTEIFLISDCESYSAPYIPNGIKLHTVHLSAGQMASTYKDSFQRIREESATFCEIDTTALALPDAARDRWLLMQDGRQLEPPPAFALPDDQQDQRRRDRTVRRQELLAAYARMRESKSPRDAVRGRMNAMHIRPHSGLRAMLRAFRDAISALIEHIPGFAHHPTTGPQPLPIRVRTK